jgi:c(7)-type cytochrome triheme protein
MTRNARILRRIAVVAAAVLATAAAAGGLEKLPPDHPFTPGEGSPGKVTFSHQSHVDPARPGCTNCHPKLFRTMEKGATSDGSPIRHVVMEKGGQCGACHGKTAFGFDSCDSCHR